MSQPAKGSQSGTELARELGEALASFPRFCAMLQVTDKSGARVPFRLNATQRAWVRAHTSRDVCLKGRQVGLTTVVLAWMVWRFLTSPGAKVAVVCQAMAEDDNVREIGRTIDLFLDSVARYFPIELSSRSARNWALAGKDATLEIKTAGASEVAADKKGRSQKFTHVAFTEAAYYEFADATFRAILNCVPPEETGSEVVIECTANGAAGAFYEYCEQARKGDSPFAFFFAPWYSHEEYSVPVEEGEVVTPRSAHQRVLVERYGVSRQHLKWWQRKVAEARGDEDFVNQEYPSDPDTCFLVSGRGFFDKSRIATLLASRVPPAIVQHIKESGFHPMREGRAEVPGLRVWVPPQLGMRYLVAADTSEGDDGSAGGSLVLEFGTGRHCATLWGQFRPWVLAKWSVAVARRYNGALLVVERNNHGHTVLRAAVTEQRYPAERVFHDRDGKMGWLNNGATRAPALDTVEQAFRDGHYEPQDPHVLREMRTFVVIRKGMVERAQASKGARDDLVLMSAIGWDVLTRPQPRRKAWLDELPAA